MRLSEWLKALCQIWESLLVCSWNLFSLRSHLRPVDIESTGILIGAIEVWGPMSKQILVENRYTTVELKKGMLKCVDEKE